MSFSLISQNTKFKLCSSGKLNFAKFILWLPFRDIRGRVSVANYASAACNTNSTEKCAFDLNTFSNLRGSLE